MSPPPFRLGEWRVDPSRHELTRGTAAHRITPKAMQVLLLLAARNGETVSREEFLEGVWRDVHVQEEVLTRAIADLRKVLSDDPHEPRFIATIPKRGYRLLAPVAPVRAEAPGGARRIFGAVAVGSLVLVSLGAVWAFLSARNGPAPLDLPSGQKPVTSLPGRELQPALSPDGERIAFVWEGEGRDNWDVYVKRLDEESVRRVTDHAAIDGSPSWSPDGRSLAFARYEEEKDCRVFQVDLDGGDEREIGSCGRSQNADLAWSPDGRLLAFSDRDSDSESFGIYLLSLATGEKRKLVAPEGQHWGDKDPAFSPDGRFLSFTRSVSMNTQDVFVVPVLGGAPERVTHDARQVRGHAFTRDGRHLLVASARGASGASGASGGRIALWSVPLDGGSPRWIPTEGGEPAAPDVGPGGELLFEERWRDDDVAAIGLDGTELEETIGIVVSTRDDREPALSPDGGRLAFVSNRSGAPELWVADALGGGPVRVTDFGGPALGAPSWSPDGERIVFDARPRGNADLFVVEAGGDRAVAALSMEDSNELHPSVAPDGKWVYFGSDRTGAWEIWKKPIDDRGARPELVTRKGGYAGRLSSDGRYLYLTKFDTPGLHRLELETGLESMVAGTKHLLSGVSWSFEDDALLFLASDEGVPALYRCKGEEEPVKVGAVNDAEPGGGLAFDPKRSRLLFTKLVRSESDLMFKRLE